MRCSREKTLFMQQKLTQVTTPPPHFEHLIPSTQSSESPLAKIMDVVNSIPLIGHVKMVEPTIPKSEFLSHQSIDICFINETHLVTGQSFQMANYVCNRNKCPIHGGETAILVHHDMDHYVVPVSDKQQMEAIAICVNIVSR